MEVKVTVHGPGGELIEEGMTELSSAEGEWRYTTKAEVPSGQSVSVLAVAGDNPDSIELCRQRKRWSLCVSSART